MSKSSPALEFDRVGLRPTWPYDTALEETSVSLRGGELVFVTLEPGHVRSPFADLAQGLIEPHEGQVRSGGHGWIGAASIATARVRAKIGRVFDVGGWVSNLDIDENVLLAQRHHDSAPESALRDRAERLARAFGLDGVPRKRPAEASQHELRISQWVRALLGDIRLLILERPTRDVLPAAVAPFLEALCEARDRGTAVFWITTDGAASHSPNNMIPPDVTARLAMRGARLVSVQE